MQFVDHLTIVQTGNGIFKAFDIAGMGLSSIPHPWALAAGMGISIVANVSSAAISITRTRLYLKSVNEQFFWPRGLKVSIKKDKEVASMLFSGHDYQQIVDQSGLRGQNTSPVGNSTEGPSLRSMRMAILAPHIAPLTIDVPPPAKAPNVLDRISAFQIRQATRKSNKKTAEFGQQKKINEVDKKMSKEESKIQKKLAKKGPSKAAKSVKDFEKEMRHLESDKRKLLEKHNKKIASTEAKAAKGLRRMEYIVVENLD